MLLRCALIFAVIVTLIAVGLCPSVVISRNEK